MSSGDHIRHGTHAARRTHPGNPAPPRAEPVPTPCSVGGREYGHAYALDMAVDQARSVVRRARHVARRIERRLPGRAAVLAYHRVAAVGVDPWELAVSPAHFAQQLAVLRDRARCADSTICSAPRRRARCARVAPSSRSRSTTATSTTSRPPSPILERRDAPATVFIAPGLLGRPSYWWDVLAELVLASGLEPTPVLSAAQVAGLVDGVGTIASRTPAPSTTCSTGR